MQSLPSGARDNNGRLTFISAVVEHSGEYKCLAEEDPLVITTVSLEVVSCKCSVI